MYMKNIEKPSLNLHDMSESLGKGGWSTLRRRIAVSKGQLVEACPSLRLRLRSALIGSPA